MYLQFAKDASKLNCHNYPGGVHMDVHQDDSVPARHTPAEIQAKVKVSHTQQRNFIA